MKKWYNNNKVKGSATLIVIIASIVFMLYSQSTYADVRHMSNMQEQYEQNILEKYNNKYNEIKERLDI